MISTVASLFAGVIFEFLKNIRVSMYMVRLFKDDISCIFLFANDQSQLVA